MKRRIARRPSEVAAQTGDVPETPGQFVQIDVKPEDIGAELLPILSRGLYTDPFHAIREYVQNAVDSGAALVRIKLTGNSIVIRDDGEGMSWSDLVKARRFGVSDKDLKENVGFRGIGIYSGYDLCDRLFITTFRAGDTMQSVLEFNFAAMKKRLEADKKKGLGTPLHELLKNHTRFKIEPSLTRTPGTTVELEEVSDYHIRSLRDSDALRKYILRNLPVDFDPQFEHREAIKKYLKEHVPGYKAVRIIVEIKEGESIQVVRPAIPNLSSPETRLIRAPGTGATIAVIWSSLHKKRSRIPDEYEDYRGFVYRTKGFTVGDNRRMQPFFKHGGSTLHAWYTGEVYVVDEKVIPNTERDDFEANAAYDVLRSQIKLTMEELDNQGLKFQSQQRAVTKLKECQRKLEGIEKKVQDRIGDPALMFSELEDIISELKQHRAKFPEEFKDQGKAAEKLANDLRTIVHKIITDARVFELIEEVMASVLRPGTREYSAVLEGIQSAIEEEFSAGE